MAGLLQVSKLERVDRRLVRNAARRTVALTRATRAALRAKDRRYTTRIQEIEEYLGLLRNKQAIVQNRYADADQQMGYAMDILYQNHIPEQSLSDYEDGMDDDLPPPSDVIPDGGSSNGSCSDSDSDAYPITASSTHPLGDVRVVEGLGEDEWVGTGVLEASTYSPAQEKLVHV